MKKIAFFLLLIVISQGCFSGRECSEENIKELTSSNNAFVGVLMRRNCGATNTIVSHINIKYTNKEFERNPETNEIAGGQILAVNGEFPIEFQWINENKLRIQCVNCLRSNVIRKSDKWNNVEIEYEFPVTK